MPSGSKKRKAAKTPKVDEPPSVKGEPVELEPGLEESMDNEGEQMGDVSLSPKTPVRDAETLAEVRVIEEEMNGENVQEGEMEEGLLSPKTPAQETELDNGIQLEDASAPIVDHLQTAVDSSDQQDDGEADPVQAEPAEEAPVGIEPEADADSSPVEIKPGVETPFEIEQEGEPPVEIEPEVEAAPVQIEQEVQALVEIEPEVEVPVNPGVEALAEIEPEPELEALAEAKPDENAPIESEPGQQDLVEIRPDQSTLVEIEPDQQVAEDEVETSKTAGDLHVGNGCDAVQQQDGRIELGELATYVSEVDQASDGRIELGELATYVSEVDQASEPQEEIADVVAEPPVVEGELGEQIDCEAHIQDLDELPTVSVSDEAVLVEQSCPSIPIAEASIDAGDERENLEITEEGEKPAVTVVEIAEEGTVESISDERELDQASESQEGIADVVAEPPVVEEELGEQIDFEAHIQDLLHDPPAVSVSDEAVLVEQSSPSIPALEASVDADDEKENLEIIEEGEKSAVAVVEEGTVQGISDERELDIDELERETADHDEQVAVDRVLNELERKTAGHDGQGAVDKVSNELKVDAIEQERAADGGYSENESISASVEDASEMVVPSEQLLGTELPSGNNEQGVCTELDEEELGTGLPPANERELGTEHPPVNQQELSMELHTAVDQELVEQGLDINSSSFEPEITAESHKPEDEAVSLAADEGAAIEEEFDLEPASSEQERNIGEDEAASSTVAEAGSVINDLDEVLIENMSDEQELDSELPSAEQEIGISDRKELDNTLSAEASDLVELGPKEEQLDDEPPPTEQDRSIIQSGEDKVGLSLASEGEAGEDEIDVSVRKLSVEQELDNPSEQEGIIPGNAEEVAESVDKASAALVEEAPDNEQPDVKLSSLQQEAVQDNGEDEVHLSAGVAEDRPGEHELNLTEEEKAPCEDGELAADSSLTVEISYGKDLSEQVDSEVELPSTANPDYSLPMPEEDPIERLQHEQDLSSAGPPAPPTDDFIEAVQDDEILGSELPSTENPIELVKDEQDLNSALLSRQLESTADGNLDDVVESSIAPGNLIKTLCIEQEFDNGDALAEGPTETLPSTDNGDMAESTCEGVPSETELHCENGDGIEQVVESVTEVETSDSVLVVNGLVSKATTVEEDGQQTLSTPEASTYDITESKDEADIHVREANEVSEAETHAGKWKEAGALPEETVKVVSAGDKKGAAPWVDGLNPADDLLPLSTAELSAQENEVSAYGNGESEGNLMVKESSNSTAEAPIEPAVAAIPKESMESVQAFRDESSQEASLPVVVPFQKYVNQRALEDGNQNTAELPNGETTLARRTKWLGCCGMLDLLLHND